MEENKNTNIEEVVASEEVMEVALADTPEASSITDEYAEMSGLTEQQRRKREIFDKITTGILIALLCSPVAIILYIFLWFILR